MIESEGPFLASVAGRLKNPLATEFAETAKILGARRGGHILASSTHGVNDFARGAPVGEFIFDFEFPSDHGRDAFMSEIAMNASKVSRENGIVFVMSGNTSALAMQIRTVMAQQDASAAPVEPGSLETQRILVEHRT